MTKCDPTHVLTISVPLNLDGDFDYDPLQTALNVVMSVTKLAVDGAVCDDCTVSVSDVRALLIEQQEQPS